MAKLILKRKKKNNRILLILIIIILSIFLSFFIINSFKNLINGAYMRYGKASAIKIVNIIINNSIDKDNLYQDEQDIFNIVQNNNGDIQLIEFNSMMVTSILNKINKTITSNLKAIEEGNLDQLDLPKNVLIEYDYEDLKQGIIYNVPVGVITNNAFLFNLGPKIPIRISFLGNVASNIKTEVKEYGINNALLEVKVHIEVKCLLLLPTISKELLIGNDIPLNIKVIQGNIPNFYLNGLKESSNLFSSN